MKKSILTTSLFLSVLLLSGCVSNDLEEKQLIINSADLCKSGLKSMTLTQTDSSDVTDFICK